jgi:hypothetical protein
VAAKSHVLTLNWTVTMMKLRLCQYILPRLEVSLVIKPAKTATYPLLTMAITVPSSITMRFVFPTLSRTLPWEIPPQTPGHRWDLMRMCDHIEPENHAYH